MFTRRDLLRSGSALTMIPLLNKLGFAEGASGTTGGSTCDPMDYVNPEFRPMLTMMLSIWKAPPLSDATLTQTRDLAKKYDVPSLPKPEVTEHSIPVAAGAPNVRVFVMGASAGASKPAVLHIHGGGYVSGRAALGHRALQELLSANRRRS